MNDSSPPQKTARWRLPTFPWFYVTRLIGASILIFGVFADHTPERGTIILTGAGLLGIDKVARSDTPKSG